MITLITVVCDSPKHARGKVAKISTFYVQDGEVAVRDNGQRRRRRRDERMKADPLAPKSVEFWRDGETEVPACSLCGRSLPDDPRVTSAVAHLAALPGPFERSIPLTTIAAIIKQLEA